MLLPGAGRSPSPGVSGAFVVFQSSTRPCDSRWPQRDFTPRHHHTLRRRSRSLIRPAFHDPVLARHDRPRAARGGGIRARRADADGSNQPRCTRRRRRALGLAGATIVPPRLGAECSLHNPATPARKQFQVNQLVLPLPIPCCPLRGLHSTLDSEQSHANARGPRRSDNSPSPLGRPLARPRGRFPPLARRLGLARSVPLRYRLAPAPSKAGRSR